MCSPTAVEREQHRPAVAKTAMVESTGLGPQRVKTQLLDISSQFF